MTRAEARAAAEAAARGLAGDISALGGALKGLELAGTVVEVRLSCPSQAELEGIAGALAAEVLTQSGARVAQKMFGAVRVVAYAGEGPAS